MFVEKQVFWWWAGRIKKLGWVGPAGVGGWVGGVVGGVVGGWSGWVVVYMGNMEGEGQSCLNYRFQIVWFYYDSLKMFDFSLNGQFTRHAVLGPGVGAGVGAGVGGRGGGRALWGGVGALWGE